MEREEGHGTAPDNTDCVWCKADISKKRRAYYFGSNPEGREMWYCNHTCFIRACNE